MLGDFANPNPPPPPTVPLATVLARLMLADAVPDVVRALGSRPNAKAKLLAVRASIAPDDDDTRALLTAAGLDADEILAL